MGDDRQGRFGRKTDEKIEKSGRRKRSEKEARQRGSDSLS